MKTYKKFKKIVVVLYVATALLFIFLNIYVLKLADNFAEKYGADHYKIGYHDIEVITSGGGGIARTPREIMVPSYFSFYTDKNVDLIYVKDIDSEYNKFNVLVQNLYDGFKIIVIITFGISLYGIIYSAMIRHHFYGYIIATISSILMFIGVTWLNFGAYIVGFCLIISTYLVYKSRFVDYNESFLSLQWLK